MQIRNAEFIFKKIIVIIIKIKKFLIRLTQPFDLIKIIDYIYLCWDNIEKISTINIVCLPETYIFTYIINCIHTWYKWIHIQQTVIVIELRGGFQPYRHTNMFGKYTPFVLDLCKHSLLGIFKKKTIIMVNLIRQTLANARSAIKVVSILVEQLLFEAMTKLDLLQN